MEKTTMLLEDYLKADQNKRLHLYLEFPEFRPDFLNIEMEQESGNRDLTECVAHLPRKVTESQ